jgi:hypothetical protein
VHMCSQSTMVLLFYAHELPVPKVSGLSPVVFSEIRLCVIFPSLTRVLGNGLDFDIQILNS